MYDLYWSTLGGGEQVDGSIAQVLAADHDVTLLGPHPADVDATFRRLGVDLSACGHRRVVDDLEASEASADFDVFVNGTYLSKAINRAPLGYYYVHFPGEVPTRRGPRPQPDGRRRREGAVARAEAAAAPDRGAGGVRPPRAPRSSSSRPTRATWRTPSSPPAGSSGSGHAPTDVLYPPVRPSVRPGAKEPLILVLGRFFDPKFGHSKKQHELLETFRDLHRAGRLPGWRMAIVGGCDAANRDYALAVRRAARGLPVDVHVNAPGALVEELLASASIYWHGAGLGEDPQRHPEPLRALRDLRRRGDGGRRGAARVRRRRAGRDRP